MKKTVITILTGMFIGALWLLLPGPVTAQLNGFNVKGDMGLREAALCRK
jgi:hypothetical protein